jgi:plasmid replication initiation protein
MDKNYIVTKSNKLIACNYDLSLQEQKIIITLASMVQPQDTEFKEYEFKIKDFINLLGVEGQNKYTELPKITKELKKKVFEIREGTDILQVSWLGGVRYKTKEGILILKLDSGLKPYMLELKEMYTSYKLSNILSLKSKYSIRMFEILKSNLFKKCIEIEIEELKKMLGIKGKSYDVYQNLKNKIILQSQKELNKKTDINFEFEEIKTGRKVTSLKFYINANKTKNKAYEEACPTLEGKSTNEQGKYTTELIINVKSILEENVTAFEAKCILDTAKGDINIIKEKYDIVSQMKRVDSVVATMIDAIKKDYQAPKGKEKVGNFNNFEQRSFDPSLENKLLGLE